ncbi:lytic polysaccharide monooxygenase [Trametes coccinea BRFM310]|uniref:lytic cellulose monooxygenase (C4-dehydrogenating) n=1 Tax=Trametes coccinea (strain BRFM310) TaxID=1353009 RepID=A0A1Y2J0F8_TRAC3|nr:lytic polysaccharide monooxygenase [Trametes coccinea BRFM310]
MFSTLPLLAAALALVGPTAVNAHGFVHQYEIGSQTYPAWDPFNDPYASPVPNRIERHIPDDGPVLDVTSPDIACNKGGETGVNAVATIAAGDKITFDWVNWPDDHKGPVSTYMASCNGDCSKFDVSSAKWFKIDAAGYTNGKWAATQLIDNGYKWTSVIPSQLKAGQYLVRHEIVALHSVGQPQFYPGCAQVKVTGDGSQEPSGSELVSLPGLYNNVNWPDIWDDNFKSFAVPGPAPAFSGSSSGSDGSDTSPSSTPASSAHASSTPATTSSAAPEKASSTQAHTSAATSAHASSSVTSSASRASSVASSSKPASTGTGRCSAKRRRGMVKRHVSHHAKRLH